MKRKFYVLSMIATIVLSLFLSACSQTEESSTSNPSDSKVDVTPKKGGTVTLGMFSPPKGVFNPLSYSDQYDSNVLSSAFDSLFNVEEDLSFGPQLAEKWEWNDNDLTVHLRQDVKWHDGEPFTADDVVYTYATLANPDFSGEHDYVAQDLLGFKEKTNGQSYAGVEKIDDHTVIFHFKDVMPNGLASINYYIVPEHVYSKVPFKEMVQAPESTQFDKLVGSGPFKFEKMVANESYELVRNDDYYGGEVYLDKIIWKVVNQEVSAGLLETGEIDVFTPVNPADYELIKNLDGVKVIEQPDFGYQYLGMMLNTRPKEDIKNGVRKPENFIPVEKFQSKEFRQAITYAINRQGLVDGLLGGHGDVMNAPIVKASWAYAGEDDLNPYPYDPEKAKSLLAEIGLKDIDGDGLLEDAKGKKLTFSLDYPSGNKVREQSAPIIAENLRAVGLDVDLKQPRDAASHYAKVEEDVLDFYLGGWSLDVDPDPRGIWGTTVYYNMPNWNNPLNDKLAAEAVSPEAMDLEYRKAKYIEWQQMFNEEMPSVLLYNLNLIEGYRDRIQGVSADHPLGLVASGQIWKWWVSEE